MNWSMSISVTVLMSCLVVGCSRSSISGKYVSAGPNEVDMLDLAEAPKGHLSGTLVISAINQAGNRNPDVIRSVTGSIYRGNVSLQIDNSGIFTNQFNAIGKLNGREMRLDIGGNRQTFNKMTPPMYGAELAKLSQNGDNIKLRKAALNDAKNLGNYMETLDVEVRSFVSWGDDRIAHISYVRSWYSSRIIEYQRCIDFIQPLALRRIPSWKWQSCVINVNNDTYYRHQIADSVAQIQNRELVQEQDLNAKIADLPQRISETFKLLGSACSSAISDADCKRRIDGLKKQIPPTSLIVAIHQYRDTLPKLHSAIDEEMRTSADGEKELSALAEKADSFLHSAK